MDLQISDYDRGWVVGFLEGEGWFGKNGRYARISCSNADLDALKRLQTILGGRIYDLPTHKSRQKQSWIWHITRHGDARRIMMQLRPDMSVRRQEQIDNVLGTTAS